MQKKIEVNKLTVIGTSKAKRIEIFRDTEQFILENKKLAQAVRESEKATVLYQGNQYPDILREPKTNGVVVVTNHRSFEAAVLSHRAEADARICVLNFASATTPGGGVANGSSAQEESLCRCSTLYPVLTVQHLWDAYYDKNRAYWNPLHTDDCIYTPGIIICKSDTNEPKRLPEDEWVQADVISCAAPNLRKKTGNIHNQEYGKPVSITKGELYRLHLKRVKHILHVAAANHVDIMILGAFGCGAFANDPETVASAMRDAVKEYLFYFKRIEFAVYCGPEDHRNYDIFHEMIGGINT